MSTTMEKRLQTKDTGYFGDPKIIRRVKQYLEDHTDILEIDLDDMADNLQRKYPEYLRRKKKAFQGLVARAFGIVVKDYEQVTPMDAIVNDGGGDEDDISSVESDYETLQERASNRANDQQTSLYFQKPREGAGDKELINISSDDDDIESREKNVCKDIQQNLLKNNAPNITIVPIRTQAAKPSVPGAIPYKTNAAQVPNVKQNYSVPKSTVVKNPTALKFGALQKSKETDAYARKRKNNDDHDSGLSSQNYFKKKKLPHSENDFRPDPSKGEFGACRSKVSFKDFAGNKEVLKELSKVILHVAQPKIYSTLGISPPRGLLLTGPPGCGKTLLAEAIAGELNVLLLKVSASELVAGVSGKSEERIRDLFNQALAFAPCVLLLEEVDAITPNRHTAQREMERRIVCQLLSCLDELGPREFGQHVLVIGTTNRPDSIDPALRRAGRFDTEFALGIPGVEARTEILRTVCKSLKLESQFDYEKMARLTPGYVGADLTSLARVAAINAFFRYFENTRQTLSSKNQKKNGSSSDMEISDDDSAGNKVNGVSVVLDIESKKEKSVDCMVNIADENLCAWLCKQPPLTDKQLEGLSITEQDFIVALKKVCPSAKREGFATVPDVTWEDVGALRHIRQALQIAILAPVKYTKLFASVGISSPAGVLLCGPPGCGKTLLAKAVANEAGINFISVKGPELLNMYLGESERAVRQCFQRARNSAPCVIFFDELDALCPKRSEGGEGGASMRVVNQMLTEMDGVEERGGVFLMAATNRPDIVDPAVMRPGRLDKILYVGFPTTADKVDILRTLTKNGTKPELAKDVNLEEMSTWEQCEGYTGADLAALVKEAAIIAIHEVLGAPAEKVVVCRSHFLRAVENIRPSVTRRDRLHYEKLQKLYSPTSMKTQDLTSQAQEANMELSSSSSVTSQQSKPSESTQQNSAVSSLSTEQHQTSEKVPSQVTDTQVTDTQVTDTQVTDTQATETDVLEDRLQNSCTPVEPSETEASRDSVNKQSSDVDSTLDIDRSAEMEVGSCS